MVKFGTKIGFYRYDAGKVARGNMYHMTKTQSSPCGDMVRCAREISAGFPHPLRHALPPHLPIPFHSLPFLPLTL